MCFIHQHLAARCFFYGETFPDLLPTTIMRSLMASLCLVVGNLATSSVPPLSCTCTSQHMGYDDVPSKRGCKQSCSASTRDILPQYTERSYARVKPMTSCQTFAPPLFGKDESGSGEALRIVWAALAFFSWILYLPLAIALCMECVLGFLLLWGRGIASVIEWYTWRSSRESHSDDVYCCYNVTPGEERRQDREWGVAVKIAHENNFMNKRDPGSEDFNVDAFLKMTTGRNMKDLVSGIQGKKRAKTSRGGSSDTHGTQGGHKDKLSFFASRLLNHVSVHKMSVVMVWIPSVSQVSQPHLERDPERSPLVFVSGGL